MMVNSGAHAAAGRQAAEGAWCLRIERNIGRHILRSASEAMLAEGVCALLIQEARCTAAAVLLWDAEGTIVHSPHADPHGMLTDIVGASSAKALPADVRSVLESASGAPPGARHPLKNGIRLLPLEHAGSRFGLLAVGPAKCQESGAGDHQWLAAVGDDMAVGISRLRREQMARREAPMQSRLPEDAGDLIKGMVYECRNERHWTMTALRGSVVDLTGYRPEQLIRNREAAYGDLIDPAYRDWVWAKVQEAVGQNQPFRITYPIRKASGERRWVWERGRGVLDAAGRPLRLEGFITDITELKKAENALRESEKRYRLLADNTLDIIWQVDMALRITYINPAVEEILGYAPETFAGTELSDHCSPAALGKIRDAIAQGLAEENRPTRRILTIHLLHKDGREIPLEVQARFLFGGTPDPVGIQGTARDISARLAAERAARQQKERLQTIVDNIPMMVTFHDAEGHNLWVNQGWKKTLGWGRDDIGKRDILRESYPDPEYRGYVQDFIRRAEGRWRDFETHTADGRVRSTVWKNVRLTDGSIIGIGEDVTEARQAGKRRQELEEQLRQAQKMEAVGRLAGGVAHDFNNLLAVVLGYAELILETLDPAHTHYEPVKDIYDAATRARDLTRQLLAFGRKQVLAIEVLDVATVIASFDKLIRRVIGEDIVLDLNLARSPLRVRADVSQLEQVLMNLAVNARDAMPDGGRLLIETAAVELDQDYAAETPGTKPGHYALIAVSDTGIGMEPATLRRIFEPFYTTKGRDAGSGLGLSTAYGIVKQHGGNIWAYSEPGHGTTFKVYLPLAAGKSQVKSEPPSSPAPPDAGVAATILVAEDDPSVRRLVERILNRKGYRVLAAANIDDARQISESHVGPIDLLLTDVIMPGRTGPELFVQVSSSRPELKVIFMSGYSGEAISRHGVLDPGTHFLQKPFSARSLLTKVAEALAG